MGENPSTANERFNAAVSAYQRGDYRTSAALYRQGLRIQPDSVPAFLDLAKVCEYLGEWDEALEALNQALRRSPDHPVGLRRRERILDEKEAFESLAKALDTPASAAYRDRFTVTAGAGVDPAAEETARKALGRAYAEFGRVFDFHASSHVVVHLLPAATSVRKGCPIWAAGIAQSNETIAVFLHKPNPDAGLLAALLRHEYAHIAVYELTSGHCPRWLDEAIAEAFAKPLMNWEREQLATAIHQDACLPLESLDLPFAELPPERVSLAYRQCALLGHTLLREYGPDAIRQLLAGLKRGELVDLLFVELLGATIQEVENVLFSPSRPLAVGQ